MKIAEAKLFGAIVSFVEKRLDKFKKDLLTSIPEVLPESFSQPGVPGPAGEKGETGASGGPRGLRGLPGRDGVNIIGEEGPPGRDGRDARPARNGRPGLKGNIGDPGRDGINGTDGNHGLHGTDGKDGAPGRDGKDHTGKEYSRLRFEFDEYRRLTQTQMSSLGGGGSTRILEMDDVVQNYRGQLANNDVLLWDDSINKFRSYNMVTLINTVTDTVTTNVETMYDKLIDDSTVNGANTFTYIGESLPGAVTANPVWRIKRIAAYSDDTTNILWANNQATFVQTWDDRASYVYDV